MIQHGNSKHIYTVLMIQQRGLCNRLDILKLSDMTQTDAVPVAPCRYYCVYAERAINLDGWVSEQVNQRVDRVSESAKKLGE